MFFLEKEISLDDYDMAGTSPPASIRGQTCEFGNGKPDGACGNRGVEMFGNTLLCERHLKEAEARERKDHWEEVDIYLNMWTKVAQARGNETLLRLLRYARLEARCDQECERQALERAVEGEGNTGAAVPASTCIERCMRRVRAVADAQKYAETLHLKDRV